MRIGSQRPEPREEQVTRIVRALEAEDHAARSGVHSSDLARAVSVRLAAERNASLAEQREAQKRYQQRHRQ